jgi:AraC family transcriptional regulator, transcriptional activator of pobA
MIEQSISAHANFSTDLKLKGFKASEVDCRHSATRNYSRKDFYKICINNGTNVIHYADKSFEVDGSILFFGNPHIPYSWETITTTDTGYTCLFSEDFLKTADRSLSLQQSPLFKVGGTPIFRLNEKQRDSVSAVFQQMIEEQATDYEFKDDLIRNYINLIIHEALKIRPSEGSVDNKNAFLRLTKVFFELLERQFPIENAAMPLGLRTAQDFAGELAVHVNYLNRSVKEVTGKPTTFHIAERIIIEARALLQHTDWPIAEVAYALGFEYPSYFNNYFKRLTGTTPMGIRSQLV